MSKAKKNTNPGPGKPTTMIEDVFRMIADKSNIPFKTVQLSSVPGNVCVIQKLGHDNVATTDINNGCYR